MLKDKKLFAPLIAEMFTAILAAVFCLPELLAGNLGSVANNHDKDLYGTLIGCSSLIGLILVVGEVIVPTVYMISAIVGTAKKEDKAVIKRRLVLFFISGVVCAAIFLLWFAVIGMRNF